MNKITIFLFLVSFCTYMHAMEQKANLMESMRANAFRSYLNNKAKEIKQQPPHPTVNNKNLMDTMRSGPFGFAYEKNK